MFGMMPIGAALSDGGAGGGGGGGGIWGGGGAVISGSSGGGVVISAPAGVNASAPGSSGGSFGPWGEGVYTPLDWPATRFLELHETLDNAPLSAGQNTELFKWLALSALALWAFSK